MSRFGAGARFMRRMRFDATTGLATLEMPSPVGRLALEARGGRLTALRFDAQLGSSGSPSPELATAAGQLEQYFAGRRRAFELPLQLPGGGFQHRVLSAVAGIPYGERTTYGQVTAELGLALDDV